RLAAPAQLASHFSCPADDLRPGVAGSGAGMAVAAARELPLELSGPGHAADGASSKATSGMHARPVRELDAVGGRGAAYRRLRRTRPGPGQHRSLAADLAGGRPGLSLAAALGIAGAGPLCDGSENPRLGP